MKRQLIIIHGGTTFDSHKEYIDFLKEKSIQKERLLYSPNWKESLAKNLGPEYEVLLPSMPNKTNAQFDEWRLWFQKVTEHMADDAILIGHSLGAIFLAKYLSNDTVPKKVRATILIAAPFDNEQQESLSGFKLDSISSRFLEQAGRVIFFNGFDDPVISPHEVDSYKKYLPEAEYITLSAPEHFAGRQTFPELEQKIISLG